MESIEPGVVYKQGAGVQAAQDSQHIAAVIARCGQKINAECSLELQAACCWPAAVLTPYNNTPTAYSCSMPPLAVLVVVSPWSSVIAEALVTVS